MIKKEMIAMLLAGGQGSRLGVLTSKVAKPAVAFGGKYRIIDFPLSNCINSGVDTVGVLTQYQPLRLNTHIGIGIPWDLDRNIGGVTVLPPYEKFYVIVDYHVLSNYRFIQFAVLSDTGLIHNDGIPDYRPFAYCNTAADYRIVYFAIYVGSFSDNTSLDHAVFRNILRRQDRAAGIYLPVFFIQVELRNNIDQLHIRFTIRT